MRIYILRTVNELCTGFYFVGSSATDIITLGVYIIYCQDIYAADDITTP